MKSENPRVLLVNLPWANSRYKGVRAGSRWPHIKSQAEGSYRPFPFFLAYATALLKQHQIKAMLIDAPAAGYSNNDFINLIKNNNFDVIVAETSIPSFYNDLAISQEIAPLTKYLIFCGPNPLMYDAKFLQKHRFIDFVIYGEYEFTLLKLLEFIKQDNKNFSEIKGLIWCNQKGDAVKNYPADPVDINKLPWPQRQGLPMDKYWDLPGDIPAPSVQMLASRGCPFNCDFCLWPQTFFNEKKYRWRHNDHILDEMEFLVKTQGYKSIYFDDDVFNIGRERMLALAEGMIKRKLDIPWAMMARVDLMDTTILQKLKKAGLAAVKYGVESSSQVLLDNCGKKLNLEKAEKIIKETKKMGIKVHLTFSFGLEGETPKSIEKTIKYAIKLEPYSVQFSILTPFPGTTLFHKLNQQQRIITKNWSLYDGNNRCVFRPQNLSPLDLELAKDYAYRRWFDHCRRRRGFSGNARRFFYYWQQYGLKRAVNKAKEYLRYLMFYRKQFLGKK